MGGLLEVNYVATARKTYQENISYSGCGIEGETSNNSIHHPADGYANSKGP